MNNNRVSLVETKTPMCDKLNDVHARYIALMEFLEWLKSEKRIHLGAYHDHVPDCFDENETRRCGFVREQSAPVLMRDEDIVFEFLEIDGKQLERERLALLKELQGG